MASIQAILEYKAQGLSQTAIANELGLTVGAVAGALYRHRQKGGHAARADSKVINLFGLPKPQIVKRAENENTDMARWESEKTRLFLRRDFVSVMHMNDVHLPYHDLDALSMWFEIAKRFKPNVVVVGSDMFDLPTISRFEPDPDISVDDWQERSRECYWPVVHQLDRLLPNALIVWIYGNHEHRALLDIKKSNSPKVGMSYLLETIRCGGRVMHVGRTENVEIGGLKVAHGNKTNKHAAQAMGLVWPAYTVNFGHIHRHNAHGNAFSNGMLCRLEPHYDEWGYANTQEQGTSVMTVDTHSNRVLWSHSKFEQSQGGLMAQYGNELISVGNAVAESEAA